MYLFINALILALLVPTGGANLVEDGPTCRAELHGRNLLTTVELPTGVAVEGPWRVMDQAGQSDTTAVVLVAVLDHVVETDGLTGSRSVFPFPRPVRLAFEGNTREDVMRRAARVWCATVMRAQQNRELDHLTETTHRRITALPRVRDAAASEAA